MSRSAEDIVQQRRDAESEVWAAGRGTCVAATVLTVQPVGVGVLVFMAGRDGPAGTVAGPWAWAMLVVALLLTVAGALWLRRVARPPFSPWPTRWRAHERDAADRQYVTDTLDLARLYVTGGLPLEDSLARGGAGWHEHPARLLERGRPGVAPTACPADRLAAASRTVREEGVAVARAQARGGIAATAVPYLAFILPATILVLAASWPGVASG